MTTEAFNFVVNCGWVSLQGPGNLAVTHAVSDQDEDLGIQIWPLLPVRRGKSLGGKGAVAGQAAVSLYPAVVSVAKKGTESFVAPLLL